MLSGEDGICQGKHTSPLPSANKQLQAPLEEFVAKGEHARHYLVMYFWLSKVLPMNNQCQFLTR